MKSSYLKSAFIATTSHLIDGGRAREVQSSLSWPLIDYFYLRCERLVVLELPLPRKGMVYRPQAVRYLNGKFIERKIMPWILCWPFIIPQNQLRPRTYLRLKIRDIVAVVWFMLFYRQRYELFIGVESLLAILGGFLKKLGVARKTVYYISDWAPRRYRNNLLNWFYIKMDWWACLLSDFIWNFTYTIGEARRNILKFPMEKAGKELWVPFGFIPDGVALPQEKDIDLRRLVYCGGIGPEYGVDLIIDGLALIKKEIPNIKLDILGSGGGVEVLQDRAKHLGLDENIVWHGYISNRQEILSYYLKAAVSLAPYAPLENSVKRYGDVIKIREAIGCGLPVITTNVPPSHKEILEKGLGEVIDYSPESLASAVIRLLNNRDYYFSMRRRVIESSKDNLWENIYDRTLQAMGYDNRVLYARGFQ